MLPLEKVNETAAHMTQWLEKEMRRFNAEEAFRKGYGSGKSEKGGKSLSAVWMDHMELPSGTKRTRRSSL